MPSPTIATEPTDRPLPIEEEVAGAGVHAADGPGRVGNAARTSDAATGCRDGSARVRSDRSRRGGRDRRSGVDDDLRQTRRSVEFESIVAVEHTVLMTQYDSVYPYDQSGRVEIPADCPVPDPLDLLAFLAASTTTLGLATGVLVLPTHHPVGAGQARRHPRCLVAEAGFALRSAWGWLREEIEACGAPFESRGRRADEQIEVLRLPLGRACRWRRLLRRVLHTRPCRLPSHTSQANPHPPRRATPARRHGAGGAPLGDGLQPPGVGGAVELAGPSSR